jgi:hypothetical protein
MFSQFEQQMGARALMKVRDAAADQFEWAVLQLWKIESKWQSALKPGLYRVTVGGHHVNGIRTRQRSNVKVRKFTYSLIPTRMAQQSSCRNRHQNERSRHGKGWRPAPEQAWTGPRNDTLFDFFP